MRQKGEGCLGAERGGGVSAVLLRMKGVGEKGVWLSADGGPGFYLPDIDSTQD